MNFELDTESFQNPLFIEKVKKEDDDKLLVENIKTNHHNDEASIDLYDLPKKEIDLEILDSEYLDKLEKY